MTRLSDVALRRGVGELFGDVDCENGPMLELCRSLDFTVVRNPDDARLYRVEKPIARPPAAP